MPVPVSRAVSECLRSLPRERACAVRRLFVLSAGQSWSAAGCQRQALHVVVFLLGEDCPVLLRCLMDLSVL